jgi:hypothetical protein
VHPIAGLSDSGGRPSIYCKSMGLQVMQLRMVEHNICWQRVRCAHDRMPSTGQIKL